MWVHVRPSGVFSQEKTTLDNLGWERFTKLFLSNIMKYGKNDAEWQTSIQGMSLSDFVLLLFKEKRRKL